MLPYVFQAKVKSTCLKILLVILGFILGLILIPIFIVACVLYFLYFMTARALRLCGCEDCDCCSLTGM